MKTVAARVREALGGVPWSRARELVRSGRVRVGGERVMDDAARIADDAALEIDETAPKERRGVLSPGDIVHLDADVVVVRKAAGLLTVPFDEGDKDTLVDRTRARLARIEKARGAHGRGARGSADASLGVVQRLDKDTTGLLVFARNLRAKTALEEQLRAHTVVRRYLAIAHGVVREARHETMLVENRGDGLRGSWGRRPHHRGSPPPEAKIAVTRVRPLRALRGATLVECRLETGRQHQIRIHLAEVGSPIVGETVYIRDFAGARIEAPRPMLHATELGFVHPRSGVLVRFEEPPPADFEAVLARLEP